MELLPDFEIKKPLTIDDAVTMAQQDKAIFLAGGTDLMPNLRRGIGEPSALIDLSGIEALSSITETTNGLQIGAGVTLEQLLTDPLIKQDFPSIAEAAKTIAGTTHRFSATVGGNLCLDTRCKFYNQSEWWRNANHYCLKYQGDICHVAPKGKICRASFSGDLAPVMLLHKAQVELVSAAGQRNIDLNDMYQEDGTDFLLLKPGEMVASVTISKLENYQTVYHKTRVRDGVDFPLVGIAMASLGDKNNLKDIRIALTGTNSRPLLLEGTEALTDKALDETSFKILRKLLIAQIMPLHSTFTPGPYRRKVAINVSNRLLKDLLD